MIGFQRATLLLSLAAGPACGLAAAEFRLGPTLGGSLLARTYRHMSQPRIIDEVRLGPTVLGGVTGEFRLNAHDHVGLEVVLSPSHGDYAGACLPTAPSCQEFASPGVTLAVQAQMRYLRAFGQRAWRPVLGAGLGVKGYRYDPQGILTDHWSGTLDLGIGGERAGRHGVRVELRGVRVHRNPLFTYYTTGPRATYELQLRLGLLFSTASKR